VVVRPLVLAFIGGWVVVVRRSSSSVVEDNLPSMVAAGSATIMAVPTGLGAVAGGAVAAGGVAVLGAAVLGVVSVGGSCCIALRDLLGCSHVVARSSSASGSYRHQFSILGFCILVSHRDCRPVSDSLIGRIAASC